MNLFGQEAEDQLKLALAVAIAGATLAALWGLFGLHDASVFRAPARLRVDVVDALRQAGVPSLEVEMRGQRALLYGYVPRRGQIEIARHAALTAAGAGGPWAGGVTAVDVLNVHVGPTDSPFAWRASRDGSSVILSGSTPSESARRALLADAAALFPNAVALDQMHAAGGSPAANWTEAARDALRQLATLNSGEARLSDAEIVIVGGGSQAAVTALRNHYQHPPAPFRARLETSVQ
ncbi:MAG TPA: hypothetical protein VG841_03975 [Caulobacterales bacterium]|nr:hypothetical protein [Caulobacterales bacterium]